MDGDDAPNRLDDSKGPRTTGEPVATRQGASERKRQDEASVVTLQGVHEHHESQDDDAVNRDRGHGSTIGGVGSETGPWMPTPREGLVQTAEFASLFSFTGVNST
jgi:hypothetical protein